MQNEKQKINKIFLVLSCCFAFLVFSFSFVFAYVASSTNYRIQNDSINIGGIFSTSTNYRIEDTLGEMATGLSTSTSYKLKAGYQQMEGASISITSPANVTLTPNISGLTGGNAYGTSTWTVITNNNTGFNMTLKASSSPALQGNTQGDSFANYTLTGTTTPEYTWSVAVSAAEFGYTVEPASTTDAVQDFLDNGASLCGTGSSQTSYTCWLEASTTAKTIINRSTETNAAGQAESVGFRAQSGSSAFKIQDTYTATTTATAVMN
jgi:hypothetical protein